MKSMTLLSARLLGSGHKHKKSNFKEVSKKVFLVFALVFGMTLFAQTKTKENKVSVPSVVSSSFQKEFPNKKVKWGMEDGGYEAEFKLNGSDASAVYDKSGHRKELEIDIKITELPVTVLDYLKKNYPSNKITEAAKITDDKNTLTYEAEIRKSGKNYDVLFDASGKFIKIADGD
jgi:hypothetical protein